MSRWIDADEVIKKIDEQIKMPTLIDCISAIKEAPSINIVRCKECRYKNMDICAMYRLSAAGVRKPDDFCSYGEVNNE